MTADNSGKRARPTKQGVVTSNKMQKSITVSIERLVRHPIYGKFVRRRTKLHAHDENQVAKIGDVVEIEFAKPISKLKRWRLVRVVRRGSDSGEPIPVEPELADATAAAKGVKR